jgi:hypothetical protein
VGLFTLLALFLCTVQHNNDATSAALSFFARTDTVQDSAPALGVTAHAPFPCCARSPSACRRTFKFLRGVLAAKWVLTKAWLQACLEQGGPVNEEQFLVGCTT